MQTAVAALGGLVLLVALVGFARSLWRPPHGEGNHVDGPSVGYDGGHHGGLDGGAHGP